MSIYAAPEKWSQTHYALEVAIKMMDFYEEYFNIPYPLPKQGKPFFYICNPVNTHLFISMFMPFNE